MCVITDDGATPVALAGVMGGQDSEVTDATTEVLIESACFSAGHTSRTSRNLDLMSEASIRFERQVDPCGCAEAADVAAALLEQCCGAKVCPGTVDVCPAPAEPVVVTLRPARVRQLAGADITNSFVTSRLERLGCTVERDDVAHFRVGVPSNRPDLTREVDLVEEVVRLWGEGDIEPTLPAARNHAGGLTLEQRRLRLVGSTLRACGLSETTTYCFVDPADLERLGITEAGRGVPVKVINPLVADQSEMRRSLLPGLVRSVAYNLDHGVERRPLRARPRVLRPREAQPAGRAHVRCRRPCGPQGRRRLEPALRRVRLLRRQGRRGAPARVPARRQGEVPRGRSNLPVAAAGPLRRGPGRRRAPRLGGQRAPRLPRPHGR